MKTELFKYLRQHFSQEPEPLDRLIVSGFIYANEIAISKNLLIKSYLIDESMPLEHSALKEFLNVYYQHSTQFNFETLIELFEYVVSPSDKIINGAVYTPSEIREYIIGNCVERYVGDLVDIKAADISCGCGGFLLSFAKLIFELTDKSYKDIFRQNLYGIDIAPYSIQRTKILLSLFAIFNGEDEEIFDFNLFVGNSLSFDWNEHFDIRVLGGFDIIVGNPPYVCSRNMDVDTFRLLEKWEVTKTGHPDLYIPFFQIGLENLNKLGVLGYITVNTFIKSINGRALRQYFAQKDVDLTLLNFGGEQVFPDRNTYTCICFLKYGDSGIKYIRTQSSMLKALDLTKLNAFKYEDLDHHGGWNLVNDINMLEFVNLVERTGKPFKNLYTTRNGIATLKNEVYKFTPIETDDEYYYLQDNTGVYPIELSICRNIINANRVKSEYDITRLQEKIIFPYNDQIQIFSEEVMANSYPFAYSYLTSKKRVLSSRDKGLREYETWYAYGRRQSMDINAYKLFFPHICERPKFVICNDPSLLFYNGMAIISKDLKELEIIKKILESEIFFKYISNTTKDYASGYISMSRNYLKNFGVYQLTEDQKTELLKADNADQILEKLYGLVGNV